MLCLNVSHCMYNLADAVLVLVHGVAVQLRGRLELQLVANLVQCSNLSFDFPAELAVGFHWTVDDLKNNYLKS